MATSKQTLIIPKKSSSNIVVTESSVKFDAKITTSDLIETILFEEEKKIRNEDDITSEQIKALDKKYSLLNRQLSTELSKFNKIYKNKDIDELVKHLNKLPLCSKKKNNQIKVSYYSQYCEIDNKLYITIQININNNHYVYEIYDSTPNHIQKIIDERKSISKQKISLKKIREKYGKKLKELPLIKKQIKSEFVRQILKDNTLDTKEILDILRKAIIQKQ